MPKQFITPSTTTYIPTEAIGSIPRSTELLTAIDMYENNTLSLDSLNAYYDDAVKDTIRNLENTGSPILCDGEQTKSSFITYPLDNLSNINNNGKIITFIDGHTRQLPSLTHGPFKYGKYAGSYLNRATKFTKSSIKQAVISASAMSLLYPENELENYTYSMFIDDLVQESVNDIRSCFENGAKKVQIDFTEGRLAVKLDPSKKLLQEFININNRVLAHFTVEERQHIGIHTCPGGDHDSTHSADVDYSELLPLLLTLNVHNFYIQLASEKNPDKVLQCIAENMLPHQRIFVGVIDVTSSSVETPELVCNRVLKAAQYIPLEQLGTTDDCGFSPFSDDIGTSRALAFEKIKSRVEGTKLAYLELTKSI